MPFMMVEMCSEFILLCTTLDNAFVLCSTLPWSPDCDIWCKSNVKERNEATRWCVLHDPLRKKNPFAYSQSQDQ